MDLNTKFCSLYCILIKWFSYVFFSFPETKLLDDIDLSTNEALQTFKKSLIAKIRSVDRLEKRPFYLNFVEDLTRELCQNRKYELPIFVFFSLDLYTGYGDTTVQA